MKLFQKVIPVKEKLKVKELIEYKKSIFIFVDFSTGNLRNVNEEALTGDEEMFTWYEVDLDREMEKQDVLVDLEWEGYVADKVWQVTLLLHFIHSNQ